jgi:WD40 repeat protein
VLLYEDHHAVVYALAFSPDGSVLASGAKDGSLWLRGPDGQPQSLYEQGPKTPAVHAIGFLPDGAVVIGHAHGWHVHRRDAGTWRMFSPPSETSTTALAVLDANTLAVGTGDRLKPTAGTFELWDLRREQRVEPYFQEPNGVRAVAACPAKELVAWATGHRQVRVWNVRKQDTVPLQQKGTSPAIALAPDGATLAAAVDWTTVLYDLERRRERAVLKGHKGQVAAVAFSPDGATVVTGSWDKTVRLWDAASGREKANFQWPVGRVYCVAYAPDGLRLAAGGDEGKVVVWDTE